MQEIQARRTTVHAAVLTKTGPNRIQLDVAEAVTGAPGGRYEAFNVPNRMLTLLPEIGAQIARRLDSGRSSSATFDRPGGTSSDLGKLTLSVSGKLVSGVTVDRPASKR